MNSYIKNILGTRGWKDIEKMFNETTQSCAYNKINTDLDNDTYAREVRANVIAEEKIKGLLNRIKRSATEEVEKKISYK